MKKKRIGRVIKAYQAAYPDPLIVKSGEKLIIGEKESEWPGWVWCTNARGKSGWVPKEYLESYGGFERARCDYDATELTVVAGERLSIHKIESGWAWCENEYHQSGWVPLEGIKMTE